MNIPAARRAIKEYVYRCFFIFDNATHVYMTAYMQTLLEWVQAERANELVGLGGFDTVSSLLRANERECRKMWDEVNARTLTR